MSRILVIGSSNTDLVVNTSELPAPSETVVGGTFHSFDGGKGANQAVAVARAGGEVAFVGAVGDDEYGRRALENLRGEGIDVERVRVASGAASGIALIMVDERGENMIAVAPGANGVLRPEDLDGVAFGDFGWVVIQLEIPLETAWRAVEMASAAGARVILNPAPAAEVPERLLPMIDTLVPNRAELGRIAGCAVETHDDIRAAARGLFSRGLGQAVVTLGGEGALWVTPEGDAHVAAPKVRAVDTVGAGDCFIGTLAVALARGDEMREAIGFATRAAALSVQRAGAQSSMPMLDEIRGFVGGQ